LYENYLTLQIESLLSGALQVTKQPQIKCSRESRENLEGEISEKRRK
jgi:hypothetical protein